MSEINNGGPAFPTRYQYPYGNGMSLRDYFAAKAMQGLLSEKGDEPHTSVSYEAWAEFSYAIADAMLAEREKKGGA